jgi:alkaline phosphatase D
VPALFKQDFLFDCDQWDGFPNKRAELIAWMQASNVRNTLLVCGDIHAGFASKIVLGAGNELPVVTAPAISSKTLNEELYDQAVLLLGKAIADQLLPQLDVLLKDSNQEPAMPIDFAKTDVHGFAVVEVDGSGARTTLHMIAHSEVTTDYAQTPSALAAKFTTKVWTYSGGTITAA